MVVLRCTQNLLVRLKQAGDLPAVESTTRLGDWYGNILRIGRRQHLLFIGERSRLPVVLPITESKRLSTVFPDAVCARLAVVGVAAADIADERLRMSDLAFARTRNRSLLGTLNDFTFMAQLGDTRRTEPESPEELTRFLSQTPILPALKSIAQNPHLDPVFAKYSSVLEERLSTCNEALRSVSEDLRRRLAGKLLDKQCAEGKRAISEADRRRWSLPKDGATWHQWDVPFDTDPDWPKALRQAVTDYRKTWRAKMEEVDTSINGNAEQEELVDQPQVVKGILRVSGPFTVEAVQPAETSLGLIEEILSPHYS